MNIYVVFPPTAPSPCPCGICSSTSSTTKTLTTRWASSSTVSRCVKGPSWQGMNEFLFTFLILKEMNKFHTILLDQASRTVLKNLTLFVKDDINQVKDYKGHFLKVSEGYDNALIKNAQVKCPGLRVWPGLGVLMACYSPIGRRAKTGPRKCRRQPISSQPRSPASSTPPWTMSTI